MNAYEYLSTIRDQSGLTDQNKVGTPLLLRILNLGLKSVTNRLYKVFDQYLIKEVILLDNTGTQVTAPSDVLSILNVWREKTAGSDDYEMCAKVPITERGQIGSIHWPSDDENNPLYINEGRNLRIYPSMSNLDVKVQYRKRIVDLAFGRATINAGNDNEAVLDRFAVKEDDAYNDYYIAFYTKGNDAAMTFQDMYKITDYTGSSRTALVDASTGLDSATQEIWYALYPLLPQEYDNLVIDATLIEIGKNQRLVKEWDVNINYPTLENELRQQIVDILGVNQIQEDQQVESVLNR